MPRNSNTGPHGGVVLLEPFPSVPFGEFTVTRPFTAPGLFAYRHMQATHLLHFPDYSGGDMTKEQREEALRQSVNLHRPLAALVIFLGVVALEDFIRELGARLADTETLSLHFPGVLNLKPVPARRPREYARPDRDPAGLSDWQEVNELYDRTLGVRPFQDADLPKLHDLALIRHTVAHHAALVREIDIPRFRFWAMQANAVINPSVKFVESLSHYLYKAGRQFETAVSDRIFSVVLSEERSDWVRSPSPLVVSLIEVFNWFGLLLTDGVDAPVYGSENYEEQVRSANQTNRERLVRQCLTLLHEKHEA